MREQAQRMSSGDPRGPQQLRNDSGLAVLALADECGHYQVRAAGVGERGVPEER